MKTFDEIAAEQGWNSDSREQVLKDFIATGGTDLDDYALKRAFEENEGSDEIPASALPDFGMDVTGEYTGNAYPEQAEYRIVMVSRPHFAIRLTVEDTGGHLVGDPIDIDDAMAEGIITMANTNHRLDAYQDDWTLPGGMDRQLFWALGDAENDIRLDESNIDEVAAWLRYATGVEAWDGGEDWEW